ncbi:WG repeat-containing protein [Polaribacter sp. R2A056_3_33]|uniref:WG repeat-containing protein n=1 Tax=Polaribacter sp. R2A056_3_33 TaxID=2745563 RepID=UPI001C4E8D68|nr:WG repeat-containing protein [Polaribacter sp. R2A056_3_33]QXP69844.1 WG repeat-containing protein [Polaribacter sp. R2A056_3_33]
MKIGTITITFLLLVNSVYSQKEVVANDFGKNYNGVSFGILKNNGVALVDTLGNVTAEKITFKKYDKNLTTFSFYEGVTYDFDNNTKLYRLIDFNKNPITEYKFKEIKPFITDNTWAITNDDKEVFIDLKGNIICDYNQKEINKQLGLNELSSSMKVFEAMSSKKVEMFYDGLKQIKNRKTKKIGFLNKSNKIVITPEYDKSSNFSNGLVAVCKLSGNYYLWGFIDSKNNEKISFKYTQKPGDFHSNRAIVTNKERKKGYIDSNGELIIPAKYDDVTDFYKGFALVKDSYYSSDVKLIDINGKIINSFDKEIEVKATKSNLISLVNEQKTIAVLRSNRKTVIINSKKEIVSKQFAKIINLINGKAFAINYDSKGISEKGLINTKGEFIVKIIKSEF